MSNESPQIFTNKPKKSKVKASTPITTASSSSKAAAPPLPPPPPPKVSFSQRYRFLLPLQSFFQRNRFIVPLVLVLNFGIGAYTLLTFTRRERETPEEDTPDSSTGSTTPTSTAFAIAEKPVTLTVQRAPIPEDQQRQLLKWMLEEKRKVKPRDEQERKLIDEEKAILKQFIRAKSLPM